MPSSSELETPAIFDTWLAALGERHLADLTFSEVRRGVVALSRVYVQRRDRLALGAALDGAGKRAAFALYYAPMHFALTHHVVRCLGAQASRVVTGLRRLVDLGCGTAAASAGWALACDHPPRIAGVDLNRWAVQEARWNLRTLGLQGTIQHADVSRAALPAGAASVSASRADSRGSDRGSHHRASHDAGNTTGILCAFTANELTQVARGNLLAALLNAAATGARVLVLEPIARTPLPWWADWQRAFEALRGRADEWHVAWQTPPPLAAFDQAARLKHTTLKGRSLWLPGVGRGRP